MSKGDPQIKVRVSDELRSGLKSLAEQRRRSMNAQIVTMLENAIQAEKAASNPTA